MELNTVADIAHEDRAQHARAPHHLPHAQDPPADGSAEPHGRPGAGAVLPPGTQRLDCSFPLACMSTAERVGSCL